MIKNQNGKISADMLVGLSALLVSLVAVIVSLYSASIDREYARASVWPRLQIYRSFTIEDTADAKGSFSYGVSNFGTGPALIKYAEVSYKGKPIQTWQQLVEAFEGGQLIGTQSHISTTVMPANFTIKPYITQSNELMKSFLQADEYIEIKLCYCSIYDECWETDRNNTPQPVEQCYINKQRAFLQ